MKKLLLPLLLASTAFADEPLRVDVEVGATVEKNVQYARGYMCDDPSLVSAEMVTRDDHNVWIVKGVKVGKTLCRVGVDKLQASYVFDVRVVPARQKR